MVKTIARKYNREISEIVLLDVKRMTEKISKNDRIRRMNAQIGMPKGFGQRSISIPYESETFYYAVYKMDGIRYYFKFNLRSKPVWKYQRIL